MTRLGLASRMAQVLLVAGLLAGCTPAVIGLGPAVTTPALDNNAIRTADGQRLALHAWSPEGPPTATLLALHGLTNHAATFIGGSAPPLRQGGMLILAYDQRGHGRNPHAGLWPGQDALVSDAVTAIRLLRARHPERPFYVIGESMGANVAMLAAAALQDQGESGLVDGWILVAPGLWTAADLNPATSASFNFLLRTAPSLGAASAMPGLVTTDNDADQERIRADPLNVQSVRVDVAAAMLDMHGATRPAMPRCCASPSLFLFGANDRVIQQAPTIAALRDLPPQGGARVALYRDGWHTLLRDLHRDVVAADILAFAQNPRAPLPSGAERSGAAWVAEGRMPRFADAAARSPGQ